MSTAWYCSVGGQERGPYDDAEFESLIASGRVGPADFAWRDGMAEWVRVDALPDRTPPDGGPAATTATKSPRRFLTGEALDGLATAAAERAAVVAPDEGPFLKVGSEFRRNGERWLGAVVASPVAFYLLKGAKPKHGGGGLVGGLLSEAFARRGDDVRTCAASDLPGAVRWKLDPMNNYPLADAIVVPKAAVRRVSVPRLNNLVTLRVDDDRFSAVTSFFGLGAVRRFLTDHGWTINQDVRPTARAAYGEGYGRTTGTVAGNRFGPAARILLVLVAVLLLIAFVILRRP